MTEYLGAARVRTLLDERGIRLTKTLGQNFVIDPNTIRKMVSLAGPRAEDTVLEVGAGAGSLTLGLSIAAAKVIALEIDDRLLPVLEEVTTPLDNVEIVHGDALAFDFGACDADVLVANLPYNIAASVVIKALQEGPSLRRLTVMTQREVAERLAAGPGSKTYGRSSVLTAFHGSAKLAGTVSRNAFYPVPNVDSAIVTIDRHSPPDADETLFSEVVRSAFAQRRKMIRQSLVPVAGANVLVVLEAAGVPSTARAEELGLDEFVRITTALAETRR